MIKSILEVASKTTTVNFYPTKGSENPITLQVCHSQKEIKKSIRHIIRAILTTGGALINRQFTKCMSYCEEL